MNKRCTNCDRRADFIFLDDDGRCLACTTQYRHTNREVLFAQMVSDTQGSYTWAEWEEIAARVSTLDFGCRFDCDGGCSKRTSFDKRACCSNCAFMFGYLKTLPAEAVDICVANFKLGNGFWTPTGCTLPWKYRSSTCMSYRCPAVREGKGTSWLSFYKAIGLGDRQFLPIAFKDIIE
jgi:hypothetical protein